MAVTSRNIPSESSRLVSEKEKGCLIKSYGGGNSKDHNIYALPETSIMPEACFTSLEDLFLKKTASNMNKKIPSDRYAAHNGRHVTRDVRMAAVDSTVNKRMASSCHRGAPN